MFDRDDTRSEPLNNNGRPSSAACIGDALEAQVPAPPHDLHHAFNENQIASKQWLLDRLYDTLGGRYGTIYILGGWYGVLGAMLLRDRRFEIGRIFSFDIDPGCEAVAKRINEDHVASGRFKAITADAGELDFRRFNGADGACRDAPDLVINTSCEHMESAEAWYRRVPSGMLQVYQSNDYFDCPEHVNCVADLDAFKEQLPMSELLHEGTLPRRKYTRFMLIGRK